MVDERVLRQDEQAVFSLRSLYMRHGYMPYKMSRFEEYDLYAGNRDFLASDEIITFTDTTGKLMALKPDVTLSIVKNSADCGENVRRVCYNESVYRAKKSAHGLREITQTGLECIGKTGCYEVCEVLGLAAGSLELISPDYILELSDVRIVSALLGGLGLGGSKRALRYISAKSVMPLSELFYSSNGDRNKSDAIAELLCARYDSITDALDALDSIGTDGKLAEAKKDLCRVCDFLSAQDYFEKITFDFSVTSDLNYYSGIVFCGYVKGIPEAILSGGEYDGLMRRMCRRDSAIGFAVYLDGLERLSDTPHDCDCDAVLVYDKNVSERRVSECADGLRKKYASVAVTRARNPQIKYRHLYRVSKDGVMSEDE